MQYQPCRPFDRTLTLVARGAELPGNGRLLVFDDISDIVSAQRAQAWGEVARRLTRNQEPADTNPAIGRAPGNEAERQAHRQIQAILTKSVKTIVDQVDAMKRTVNDFRDYARLPAAELKPVDLNGLVTDVLQLYEGVGQNVPVRAELDAASPKVMGDAQQLRQVIHNLLQNALDASESSQVSTDTIAASSCAHSTN